MIVKETTKEGTLLVDLITLSSVQNYSIAECINAVTSTTSTSSDQTPVRTLKPLPVTSNPFDIKVLHVVSPNEFYIIPVEAVQDCEVMKLEMTEFYKHAPVNFTLLKEDVVCAMEDTDGGWNRVEVKAPPNKDGDCEIQFVDTGMQTKVRWHALYELDKQFYDFHRYVKRCSLSGIQPIGNQWTTEAKRFLCDHLINICDRTEIIGEPDRATLLVHHRGIKININQSLVYFKHAQVQNTENVESIVEPYEVEYVKGDEENENTVYCVEIINKAAFNPFNFRVKYVEYSMGVEAMTKLIQKAELQDRAKNQEEVEWKVGDICLVNCVVNNMKRWHRGLITSIGFLAHVLLCEHGIEVKELLENLKLCPREFANFGSSIVTARLACTKTDNWSSEGCQAIIDSYDTFFINFKTNNSNQFSENPTPRLASLFGRMRNNDKQNIIVRLEQEKLVTATSNETPLIKRLNHEMTLEETFERLFKAPSQSLIKEDLPPTLDGRNIHLEEYNVVLTATRIQKWLPTQPITKSNFKAIISDIDMEGTIRMYEYEKDEMLKAVNKVINKYFKGKNSSYCINLKAGDPCLAMFKDRCK